MTTYAPGALKEERGMKLTRAEQFFYDHGGYSWDPKRETQDEGRSRCAKQLAACEAWAGSVGLTVQLEDDWSLGMSHRQFYGEGGAYEEAEPHSCEFAWAELSGETFGGLGCIDDADADYRRVIEAELAAETLHEVLSAIERQRVHALVEHA